MEETGRMVPLPAWHVDGGDGWLERVQANTYGGQIHRYVIWLLVRQEAPDDDGISQKTALKVAAAIEEKERHLNTPMHLFVPFGNLISRGWNNQTQTKWKSTQQSATNWRKPATTAPNTARPTQNTTPQRLRILDGTQIPITSQSR
jgi:hypothetical protein